MTSDEGRGLRRSRFNDDVDRLVPQVVGPALTALAVLLAGLIIVALFVGCEKGHVAEDCTGLITAHVGSALAQIQRECDYDFCDSWYVRNKDGGIWRYDCQMPDPECPQRPVKFARDPEMILEPLP